MNNYSDQAVAQWIEDVLLLDEVVVRSYQEKYNLSYLETLSTAVLFAAKQMRVKLMKGLFCMASSRTTFIHPHSINLKI